MGTIGQGCGALDFSMDAAGTVRGVFPRVCVDGHAEKVLEALRAL